MMGTPATRRNMSIDRPGTDRRPIIERVLKVSGNREKYHAYIDEYLNTIFAKEKMLDRIDTIAKFVRPMESVNGDKATGRFELVLSNEPHAWEPHPLKFYVEKRHESIRAQLAGTLEGDSVGFGGEFEEKIRDLVSN